MSGPVPILTFNGLNALALPIALILHSSSGMVRMSTIRNVADARRLEGMLPEALDQLQAFGVAEVCPLCDCLISKQGCDGQWCELHRGVEFRTRHLDVCPRATKKPLARSHAAKKRRTA